MSHFNCLCRVPFVLCCFCLMLGAQSKTPRDKGPRAVVLAFFAQLKAQEYDKLYEHLPAQLQQQLTREQLVAGLKRLPSFIELQRMEIGRGQQKDDTAVIDTTIFGTLKQPLKLNGAEVTEGRIVVQQYLVKENGQWKIATADERTRAFFLKRRPEFTQQFQLAPPQLSVKQNGQWQAFGRTMRPER